MSNALLKQREGHKDDFGDFGCTIWFGGRERRKLADVKHSTLMYIEAEAKMDSFQAQDGTQRTALNLLQRM